MAFISADRVKETTTTEGTGNVTLAGAATGFRTFASVMANNDICYYCIAGGSDWEVGIGTFVSATPALARTTILASSNTGSVVSLAAGTKDVFITYTAERFTPPIETSPPTSPSSGLLIYARSRAGRMLPEFIGPSGVDSAFQPALFGNNVTMWLPGTGTTAAIAFGVSFSTTATQAHPTIANTSIMTSIRRATYTTTTTAGNASGVRTSAPVVIRNRGFFFFARFGILTYTSTMQVFVGLMAGTSLLAGEPSAQNNSVYCGKDSTVTYWQIATRDASAASITAVGRTTAASGDTNIFDFTAFCKPADSKITVRLVDMCDGTVLIDNHEKTANLPDNATALSAQVAFRNSAGGAGSGIAGFLNRIYIETDY